MSTDKRLCVTLRRSLIRSPVRRRASVAGLGLRRIGQTVELEDTPAVRGMIEQARHLLEVSSPDAGAMQGKSGRRAVKSGD